MDRTTDTAIHPPIDQNQVKPPNPWPFLRTISAGRLVCRGIFSRPCFCQFARRAPASMHARYVWSLVLLFLFCFAAIWSRSSPRLHHERESSLVSILQRSNSLRALSSCMYACIRPVVQIQWSLILMR